MTLENLLVILRRKLLEACEANDRRALSELSVLFTVLAEIGIEEQWGRDFIVAVSDMGHRANDYPARNGKTGERMWLGEIPTEAQLREIARSANRTP